MKADLWLPLAPLVFFGVVTALTLLYRKIYDVRERTAEEVAPFLRTVPVREVEHLFSAATEHFLRLNMTREQFRRAQLQRIHLALEYVRRISHNALIAQQWAAYEMGRARAVGNAECGHLSVDLVGAGVHCRMCSFVLRARLHTWLFRMAFLPFLAPPSFDTLIKYGSADLLDFYGKVRSTAFELGHCYGDNYQDKLAELM